MNTRTALLDSAERAARQRGYDAFSYADLARDVGIRKASIHHHFPAKADLALSLIERYADRFFETLGEIDSTHRHAAEKLRAYVALYRDALVEGTQLCLCVAMSAGRDSLAEPVLDRLNQFHEKSAAWLTGVFEESLDDQTVSGVSDPNAEARATLALVEGAQLVARAAKNTSLFDAATAAFAARLSAPKPH
ncbi:MAG: TetR/AcrR family transcriptional regulator [Pseudomonadota bacterium]